MLSVKPVDQFQHIPEILSSFPASPYVTVTRPLYEILELPVESFKAENPVEFPCFRVVDTCRLWFRWRLAGGSRCIAVEERDLGNVVLPDRIGKVFFGRVVIDGLTYRVQSCRPEVPR